VNEWSEKNCEKISVERSGRLAFRQANRKQEEKMKSFSVD